MRAQSSLGLGRIPGRIAGWYAVFGLLWIWLSDSALIWLGFSENQWFLAGAGKGTFFVATTALLLYGLLLREVAAARRADSMLRAVVQGTTDAIFVKDRDGKYLLANDAAAEFIGRSVHEIIGQDDRAIFDRADADRIIANDRATMEGNHVVTLEETITSSVATRTYQAIKAPYRDANGEVVGLIGIARDITEARQASRVLQESEQRFRAMADASPVLMWLTDETGNCTWFNRQWLEFVGRTLDEESGDGWVSGVHADDRDVCQNTYRSAFDARRPFVMEYRLRRHDGVYRWVLDSGVPRITDNEFAGYIGSCVDITDRKAAEDALRTSEEKFRLLADAIPQIVFTAAPDGNLIHVNARAVAYSGQDQDALLGTAWDRGVHPDDLPTLVAARADYIRNGTSQDFEFRILRFDGAYRWHVSRQVPVRANDGSVIRWYGTYTDIDDMKRTESALRETESRLREAQRIARSGSWAWEPQTNCVWWSNAEFELFGTDPQSLRPSFESFLSLLHPDDRPVALARVEAMLAGADEFANDMRVIRPDGAVIWIHSRARATRDATGALIRVEGTDQDITARRLAELAAQQSERQLQAAIEVAELGIILLDYDAQTVTLSRHAAEQFGFAPDVPIRLSDVHSRIHPDDRAEIDRRLQMAMIPNGTASFSLEHRVIRPDESTRWLSVRKQVSFLDNRPVQAVVVTLDVTSRRMSEEALRSSESRYRLMFQSSPHPMWVFNTETFRFLAVNDAAVSAYGFSRDEFLAMTIREIRPEEEVQRLETVVSGLTPGFHTSPVWRHRRKDGSVFYVEGSSHDLPDEDGRARLVMAFDITERLQAEIARDELLARLQLHIDLMPFAYVCFDKNLCFSNWNPAAERIFGYSRDEILGRPTDFLVHPEDMIHIDSVSHQLKAGRLNSRSVNRNVTKDGRVIVCEWHNTPLFADDGTFAGVMSMTSDITDRVQAEEALRESERRLRLALEAAGSIAFTWDIRNDIVTRYFSTEPALPVTAESIGTLDHVRSRIHPDDLPHFDSQIALCLAEGTEYRNEYRVVRPDGTTATLEEYGYIDRLKDQTASFLTGISIDISDRVAAVDALRISEERLRVALQGARGGVWDWDLASGDVWWSPEVYDLMGAPAGFDTRAAAAVELILEDDRQRVLDAIAKSIADRVDYHCEFRVHGGTRWLSSHGRLFCDSVGQPVRLLGISWEISDRMIVMESLKESESRYRRLMAVLPTAVVVHDGDKVLYCNQAFVRIIGGSSVDEVLNRDLIEFFSVEDLETVLERLREISTTTDPAAGAEIWLTRLDGRAVPAYSVSTPMTGYGPLAFLVALSDLTEREQATQLLRSVLSSVGDAILTLDEHGVIGSVNQAAIQQFRYDEEELIGANVNTLIPEPFPLKRDEDTSSPSQNPVSMIAGLGREVECCRRDGSRFPAELTVTEFSLEGKRHFTSVVRDITERQRLQAQFIQAQKMEAVGRLAGGVAHDFNNLLTIINGYCDLLMTTDFPATDKRRDSIASIRQAGERAAQLTQQLLAFSRKAVIEPRVIDLNELVTDSARLLRRLIGEDIILAVITSAKPIRVKVDPGQLEQVIMNLFVNARDAMPSGGRLTIETSTVKNPESSRSVARLSVSDTGYGISEDVKQKVFEPFFTTKGVGKGTGLGLAVVHGVVTQSGGKIEIESSREHGTTFHIDLPLISEMPTFGSKAPVRIAAPGSETILLVEDDDAVRKIASLSLQTQGYKVLEANGGAAAIALAENYPDEIHVLVSDVVMPEIGGRQLLDAVRKYRPGIPVLFMSGYTDDAVLIHGVLEVNDAFIQKPFTPLTLARKIRDVIDTIHE